MTDRLRQHSRQHSLLQSNIQPTHSSKSHHINNDQSINQQINQSTNQSLNQSFNQSVARTLLNDTTPKLELSNLTAEQRDLLTFYELRLDNFESDRQDFLSRVQSINQSIDQRLQYEQQSINHSFIIAQLQKELSDAKTINQSINQSVLEAQAEVSELRIQSINDRQRINQLLKMTREYRETKKEFEARNYPRESINHSINQSNNQSNKRPIKQSVDAEYQSIIESMKINQSRLIDSYQQQSRDLLNDRKIRESQHKSEIDSCSQSVDQSNQSINQLKDLYCATLIDYLNLKHSSQKKERQLMHQIASLSGQVANQQRNFQQYKQQVNQSRKQEKQSINQSNNQSINQSIKPHFSRRPDPVKSLTQRRASDKENRATNQSISQSNNQSNNQSINDRSMSLTELNDDWLSASPESVEINQLTTENTALKLDLSIIEQQYQSINQLLNQRCQYLEDQLIDWTNKAKHAEKRRENDRKGYEIDLKQMRKEIKRMKEFLLACHHSQAVDIALSCQSHSEINQLEDRIQQLAEQLER